MLFGISLACLVIWPFFVAKNFKKYFLYNFFYFITIAAFFFDQYTKKLAIDHLKLSRIRIPIIEDVLYFFYVENYGAAFGILQGKIILFKVVAVLAIIIIIIYSKLVPRKNYWLQGALAMLLGGALGNFADRLRFNCVIDFIYIKYKTFEWPVFNFADVFIDIGVAILFVNFIFAKEEVEEKDDQKIELECSEKEIKSEIIEESDGSSLNVPDNT